MVNNGYIIITGWWFGLFLMNFPYYIYIYIGNNNPNWRSHIFQRGGEKPPISIVSLNLDMFDDTRPVPGWTIPFCRVIPWYPASFRRATKRTKLHSTARSCSCDSGRFVLVNVTLWVCQNNYWKWPRPSRNSGFTYEQWWFSIVFCNVYRRVTVVGLQGWKNPWISHDYPWISPT